MAAVILILGLVAAGVYTGDWGFYLAAAIGGGMYLLIIILIAAVAATAKSQLKDIDKKFGNRF